VGLDEDGGASASGRSQLMSFFSALTSGSRPRLLAMNLKRNKMMCHTNDAERINPSYYTLSISVINRAHRHRVLFFPLLLEGDLHSHALTPLAMPIELFKVRFPRQPIAIFMDGQG
jgi:hypothetical protein